MKKYYHLRFYTKIDTFSDFEKVQGFFNHLFFQKTANFERFENFYYSSRILRQIGYNLVKKSRSET